ncbi:MAG: gamma-glutamyltransferase [Promethearchaeota archaeon]
MKSSFNWKFPYSSQRMPVLAENVVCTSQPLASQAGLRMLLKGGNAMDAILASAIALTVVEPTSNGLGSDAFALFWNGNRLKGLNASGRSPAAWTPEYFSKYKQMPSMGWDASTIPGAVSAWVKLWKDFGTLEFKELFEPAIDYARNGYIVSPITAWAWKMVSYQYKKYPNWVNTFIFKGKAPKAGQLIKLPYHADTLELIAESEGEEFYRGSVAEKIEEHAKNTGGTISREDLKNHEANWVEPLEMEYQGVMLHEIPPNGQGIAALMMLGILKNHDISSFAPDSPESIHLQLEAMKLAFADAHRYVADLNYMEFEPKKLLDPDYLNERSKLINPNKAQVHEHGFPNLNRNEDTVYLTAADQEGMMVSYIQSNFWAFGSGIVIPKTGISLQNRGAGFTLKEGHPNQVGPNKRPYHTIIPAFVTMEGEPLMSFGVMGGAMQPQGHVQMMIRIFQYKQNPQASSDAPRWRVMEGLKALIESGFKEETRVALEKKGPVLTKSQYFEFGGAQIIYKLEKGYCAASDHRKDGQAVGY